MRRQPAATKEAFEAATVPYYEGLVRRVTLVVGDHEEALDVVQSTYVRAFKAWPTFQGDDPRGWLYTIAIRLALNERRRRVRLVGALRRLPADPPPGVIDVDLYSALLELEPKERAIVLWNSIDGYAVREIGQALGVPPSTVSGWLSRTRSKLRSSMDRG